MSAIQHVLLTGRIDDAERERYLHALRSAAPEFNWWSDVDGEPPRAVIAAAVVANPAPGALAGMQLRLVQSLWAGVENLLADDSLPPAVPLARMVDPAMTAAMAETALWAVLSLQRGFFDYARQQRAGVWQQHAQHRAADTRVLVLGLGQMGSAVATRLAAQGYRVSAWHARAGERPPPAGVDVGVGTDALAGPLAAADIVINLLPLTPATRGLLDARFFAAMAMGASLVNLARGAHLIDDDLLAALDGGHLRHALLDVFQAEPLSPDHAYWQHPLVTVLPHVAALTDARSAAEVVATNLRALRDGAPLRHLVDRARGY
ncbi:MAG: glyoxylate/hydroxypyruvate reductase A [Pseudomonadota bacterium]